MITGEDYTNIDIPVYVVKYGDVCFAVYEDKEDVQKICELLNELHEENESITLLAQHNYKESKRIINRYVDRIKELEKENKELKEILKHTYEIHECETCKHNENFNWLDPATMKREYNSKCSKGLYYDDEVHDCEEYELDLEMFKKRVKR